MEWLIYGYLICGAVTFCCYLVHTYTDSKIPALVWSTIVGLCLYLIFWPVMVIQWLDRND